MQTELRSKQVLLNEDYVEITQGLTEGQTIRLPNLAVSNTPTIKVIRVV